MIEFRIPIHPEELQTKFDDFPLALSSETDVRFSDDLAERVINDLVFNEPPCILEQSQFDTVYIIARHSVSERTGKEPFLFRDFNCLGIELQNGLFEAVSANLKILSKTISTENEELKSQRSAIKAYVFFMNWVWIKAEEQYLSAQRSSFTPNRRNTAAHRSHGAVGHGFNWTTNLENALSALSALLRTDLTTMFNPAEIDRRMMDLCLAMGVRCLENWEILKNSQLKDDVFHVFATCAVKHRLGSATASTLILAMQKAEQLPSLVAELAHFTEERYEDDTLTEALLGEVTKGSPHDYSSQWEESKGKSQAIKSLAKLFECLGENVPLALLRQSSVLEPYWCCTAYPVRSALVSAMGEMIVTLKQNNASEQHQILDRLIQRSVDVNAFTRSRCLSVWVQLARKGCIPLEYWLDVTTAATERLQDCSSIVRKSALCLLQALIEYNPFGDNMNAERFQATFELYKKRLDEYPSGEGETENRDDAPNERLRASVQEGGSYRQICHVVQYLETATNFANNLGPTLKHCDTLLSSTSVTVVQEVVNYLVVCKQFSVKNVEATLKTAFALVFSREQVLRDAILNAFAKTYVNNDDDLNTAQNFVRLTVDATMGELTCLEEIFKVLLLQERIPTKVVKALILIALDRDVSPEGIPTQSKIQGAVSLLAVCAPHCQELLAENIHSILEIGFVDSLSDGSCVSQICRVLKCVGAEYLDDESTKDICCALVQILFETHMPNADWFEVAESAVGTLYSILPFPDELAEEILQEMSTTVTDDHLNTTAFTNGDCMEDDSPRVLSKAFLRFCFLIGQIAVHHLIYVEICTEIVKSRLVKEHEADSEADDDPMGGVVNQQDLELDNLKQQTELELLNPRSLIGTYAPMISSFCHALADFLEAPLSVQISLTLALAKLMSIDFVYCQRNLRLLFTLLQHERVDTAIKENLIMHLSDLIIRFPNLMEPWTPHIYDLLSLMQPDLQRTALLVLTHLILSDMIKVKGYISKMIVLMRAEDARLRSMATSFVNELDSKATRTFNPIYNIFPEVLSNLQQDPSLSVQDFQVIIQYLLKFTKEKHGEKLVEKLCLRFESESRIKNWRSLTFSIKCLQLGDRGFRKLTEMLRYYRACLADEASYRNLKETCAKVKRTAKTNDLKSMVGVFENELTALHDELQEDMDMESETSTNADTASELTFARMEPSGVNPILDDHVAESSKGSERKRKASEQDELSRRSEIRLLGQTSRLDRIPERRDSSSCSISRPPSGEQENQELGVSAPIDRRQSAVLNGTRETQKDAVGGDRETGIGSPQVERRLSRLSISKEIIDSA